MQTKDAIVLNKSVVKKFLPVIFLTLASCQSTVSDSSQKSLRGEELVQYKLDNYLNSVDPDKGTPVVSSQAQIAKYVSLFANTCLKTLPDFASVSQAFAASGLQPVMVARYEPIIQGYTAPGSEFAQRFMQNMSPTLRSYAETHKNADGKIPIITDFWDKAAGGMAETYFDGVAVAEISKGPKTNDICSVRIKTRDDDRILAELEKVVNRMGLASGTPSRGGLLGAGYVIGRDKRTHITVGRQKRSNQSPTYISAIIFNKR